MPKAIDKFPAARGAGATSLYNPLRSQLDWESSLADTTQQAGTKIRQAFDYALDEVIDVIYELTGLDLADLKHALDGIDLSTPGAILAAINAVGGAVGQIFDGIISISRIADVIQDLINGAGEFLSADSVAANPFWSWDSVMPGWLSGGSIRATANGTQQMLRAGTEDGTGQTQPFRVFEGQVLKLRAGTRWTGVTAAAGSNPIKVGWTPYDADGNPLADVIKDTLQPSTTDSTGWQWIPVSDWTVPAGVKYATPLVILDSGATAGNVWISNVLPWAAQMLMQSLVANLPQDLQDLADGVADAFVQIADRVLHADFNGLLSVLGGTTTQIAARLAGLNSSGQFDVTKLLGLLTFGQVNGLSALGQQHDFIRDILSGTPTVPPAGQITDIKNWFSDNNLKTQGLNSSGQLPAGSVTGTFPQSQIANLVSDLGGKAAASALTALQMNLAATPGSVIGNINSVVVDGTHTVQNLLDQFGQAFGGASSGNTTATAAAQAQQTAAQAEAAATQAAALAAWFAAQQQDAVAPTGLNFNTSFGGSNGSALNTSDWQSQSNIVNVGTYGYMGLASSLAAGSTYSVYGKHACTTQNQRISITLGDQGAKSTMPLTVCWFTGATSFAGGACLQIANNGVTFGYMNGGGSLTTWASYPGTLGQGANITAYNVGNVFVVQINGVVQPPYTDSGNVVTYTNTGQFVFMGRTSSTNWLGQVTLYDSFRIAGYGLADYNPGGSGTVDSWLLTRSSTSVVSVSPSSGAASALPSGFLTATSAISGASVTTLGTGVVTIATTGWYDLNAGIPAQTTMGNVGPTAQSNMAASPWCVMVNGSQVTGPLHGTIRLKLNAGDTVQPAYFAEPVGNFVWYRSATTNSQLSDVNKISGLAGFAHWSGVLVT